jgi:excisionase family DNA binding protein
MSTRRLPNSWTPQQAADWAEIKKRTLLKMLADGLLPAIRVGGSHVQELKGGIQRQRSAWKWIIPREAFQQAWRNFKPEPSREKEPAA